MRHLRTLLVVSLVAVLAPALAQAQSNSPVRPSPTRQMQSNTSSLGAFQRQNEALYDMKLQSCAGNPSCLSDLNTSMRADQQRLMATPQLSNPQYQGTGRRDR